MSDLECLLREVTPQDVQAKRAEVNAMFQISGDSPSDPIARKPSVEQMEWSYKVAAAQEKLVRAYDLDALAYDYHGAPGGADE